LVKGGNGSFFESILAAISYRYNLISFSLPGNKSFSTVCMWFAESIYLSAKSSSKTTLKSRAYKHKEYYETVNQTLPDDVHLADGLTKTKPNIPNPTNKQKPLPTEFQHSVVS